MTTVNVSGNGKKRKNTAETAEEETTSAEAAAMTHVLSCKCTDEEYAQIDAARHTPVGMVSVSSFVRGAVVEKLKRMRKAEKE